MQGENMRVRKLIALLIVVSTILTVFITNPNQVNAATATMLARDVEYVGSTQIKSMISSLNIDRTSGGGHYIENGNKVYVMSSALVHSKSLQYIAEQRAAELLMKYDYVRPNGKQFNTLSNNSITSDFERFFTSDKLLSGQEIYNKWFNVGTAESAKYLLSDIYKSIGVACLKYNNKYYYVIELSTKTDSSVANITDCKVNKNIEYDPSVVPMIYKMSSEEISAKIGERSLVFPYLYGYRGQVMESVYPFGNDSSKITVKLSAYNSNDVLIEDVWCTPKKAGRIRVKASFYYDGSLFFADDAYLNTSTVSISDSNVVITSESAFYTGAAVVPKITVKYKDCVFTEGVDYKIVNPQNNINCSETTKASVDIQGIGSLTGTKKYEYNIHPMNLPEVVSVTNPVYNGKKQTPSIKITFKGKTLVEGKDYRFVSEGYTNADTYEMAVCGMGNFSPYAYRLFEYKILPYTIKESDVGTISDQVYVGNALIPENPIVVNNQKLVKGIDYFVSYESSIGAGTGSATYTFKGNYTSEKPIVRNFKIVTPTPTVTTAPTVTTTPTVTTAPTVTTTPTVTTAPTVTPKPTVTATPKPTVTVKPTVTPTATPVVTAKPTSTVAPSVTSNPTATPVVTEKPVVTAEPKPTTSVVPSATSKPTVTPLVTVKPVVTTEAKPTSTVAPSATSEPVDNPTSKPTVAPTTNPTSAPITVPTSVPTNVPSEKPTVETTKAPSVEDFAERLYTTCLGRDAEKAGKDYWVTELKGGKPGSEVAEGFFFSPEFIGFELDNEEYITRLYRTFMGREPDKDGIDYWSSEMDNGKDRKFVFDGFVNSPEWADICLTYGIRSGGLASPTFEKEASAKVIAFAERLYTTCLGRAAEKEGLEWWSAELANLRQTGTVAAQGFFYSPEFIGLKTSDDEYVTRLYRTFMGREPEDAGFKFWTDELKAGKDRQYVFDGFSVAPEFANLCADAGIMR